MACDNGTESFYPEFVPNQLLTSTQLNQLRDYLDRQDRRGRLRLVGTGIVFGLGFSRHPANHRITVGEGFGVTSGGYLIEQPAATYSHFRSYADPDLEEADDGSQTPSYEPWQAAGGGQLDILELLRDGTADGAAPLAASTGNGRVLVLYLEKQPVDLQSCLVTDCNNKGLDVHLHVRALLVLESDLDAVAACVQAPQRFRIPRFHTETLLVNAGSAAAINQTWAAIISGHALPLRTAVLQAFTQFGGVLDLDVSDRTRIIIRLGQLKAAADAGTVGQYHYDLLQDLAAAHNEFYAAACELVGDCCPDQDFPRHLMLGPIDGSGLYRHDFVPSPVANVLYGDLERVKKLFLRIAAMAQAFGFTGAAGVRLTPSHSEAQPLGARAVPYYYRTGMGIEEHWQPRLCCTVERLWWYRNSQVAGLRDLDFDYARATLVRIEGHLGLGCAQALEQITQERGLRNASFEVLCSHLEDQLQVEREFGEAIEFGLAHRRQTAREFHDLVMEAARDKSEDPNAILQSLHDFTVREKTLFEQLHAWTALRSRPSRCDDGALRADYLAARAEIFCLFHRFLGELEKRVDVQPLPIEPATPEELPEGARMMIGDRLAAELISVRKTGDGIDDWLKVRVEEGIEAWSDWSPPSWDPPEQVDWTLRTAAAALRAAIDRLLHDALPGDLRELSLALFRERCREVTSALLVFRLLWWSWEALDSDGDSDYRFLEDLTAVALPVSGSCLGARIAALYAAYDALRERDLAPFTRLAARHPGLEHLAGVEKCGTFVLVCENDRVVADFSLPCRLPCCCEDAEICLPPVALPDYRIVELEKKDEKAPYEPVELEFRVMTNDYDPNPASGETPNKEPLAVVPESFTTALGGEVQIEESGRVNYRLQEPSPGTVDRFLYTLKLDGDRCQGFAVGEVLILMAGPEPEAEPGHIAGRVSDQETGNPLPYAAVRLLETGAVPPVDSNGEFAFRNLEPETYNVEGSFDGFATRSEAVVVRAGETAELKLELQRMYIAPVALPDVVIRVLDAASGQRLARARVELGDLPAQDTDGQGRVRFAAVEPGSYTATAKRRRYRDETDTLEVFAQPLVQQHEIQLQRVTSPNAGTVLVVVESSGEPRGSWASVTLRGETGSGVTRQGKTFQSVTFETGPGSYRATGSTRRGTGRRVSVDVAAGETVPVTIPIEFRILRPGALVEHLLAERGVTADQAETLIATVAGERFAGQLGVLDAAGGNRLVAATAGYRSARALMTRTLQAPALEDEGLISAYQGTAASLRGSISRVAQPERKQALRGVLLSVSQAVLDRLALSNPKAAGPRVEQAVTKMAQAVAVAGVRVEQLRKGWRGERLAEELGVASVATFLRRMR